MYGKINENGRLEVFSGKSLTYGGKTVISPKPKHLAEAGFKPIEDKPAPPLSKGQTIKVDYRDAGDRILTVYEILGGAL